MNNCPGQTVLLTFPLLRGYSSKPAVQWSLNLVLMDLSGLTPDTGLLSSWAGLPTGGEKAGLEHLQMAGLCFHFRRNFLPTFCLWFRIPFRFPLATRASPALLACFLFIVFQMDSWCIHLFWHLLFYFALLMCVCLCMSFLRFWATGLQIALCVLITELRYYFEDSRFLWCRVLVSLEVAAAWFLLNWA